MKKLVKDRLFNSVAIAALVGMVCIILIEGFWPSLAHAKQGLQVTGGAQGSADLGDGWPVPHTLHKYPRHYGCGWPQPCSPFNRQQIKATGRDAYNIILNSDVLASGYDPMGWARYTVRYVGDQYPQIRGVVFNCKCSPNARQFECVNWLPPQPTTFQSGNWSIQFEYRWK